MPLLSRFVAGSILLLTLGASFAPRTARAASADRQAFANSVLPVATTDAGKAGSARHGFVSRLALTADESSRTMTVEVALTMRSFAELQSRIAKGEQISPNEMAQKYFPLAADHDRVVGWLKDQRLSISRTDTNHLAVFATGTVDAVARAFGVTFARVAAVDGEYTSAISAPSLPSDVAAPVLGIHGLQPHLHPRRLSSAPLKPSATTNAGTSYLPAQIAAAYGASGLGLTGSGQTIAIFAAAYPSTSDLTSFFTTASVSASASNIQQVNVGAGPGASPSADSSEEATLDVEWASALAPGATIRIYGANENDPAIFDQIFQAVYADQASRPNMHVLSVSFGGSELETPRDFLIIESQYMANLAAAGVTVLVASGDDGAYNDGVLQVTYPTSDPDVTGVGATTLHYTTAGGVSSETAWSGGSSASTGGGVSAVFTRPAWQTGTGVPSGTTRCVPDVASAGDPSYGAVIVYNGSQTVIGGTSWSAPTWAAFCALMNQSRASAGTGPLGLLNPRIYPLIGTTAFRDITAGNNNYYSAGVGYDLCTGIGSPIVSALLPALKSTTTAPAFIGQTGNAVTVVGQPATFYVSAEGSASLTYQWQRQASGSSGFTNLSNGSTYSGTTTPMMVVSGTTTAMTGDQFQCVVTNGSGSVTSPAASLTVNGIGVTTFAGWPGSGGAVDGAGWAARFDSPGGIKADSSNNLYVSDSVNCTIRKITPAGVVSTFAGLPEVSGSADGNLSTARFSTPGGVAIDSAGNVYVADSGNYTIRKITPSGIVTTLAGSAGVEGNTDGTGSAARFEDPENVVVDGSGNLWVADGIGNTIREVTPAGVVTTVAGSKTRSGSTDGTGTGATFNDPTGIAIDSSGNLYVADNLNSTIRKITPSFVVTTLAGSALRTGSTDGTGSAARFYNPAGVGVDASGNVYVADFGNGTVRAITPGGVVTTIGGLAQTFENIDGLSAASRFVDPSDIAVDSSGNVFAVDPTAQTVRRIVPASTVIAKISGQPSSATVTTTQKATFSVTATSSYAVSYQWQSLAPGAGTWTPLSDGSLYSGSQTSTLTVTNPQVTADQTQFECVVTNIGGSVTSSPATLYVLGTPVITSSPQSVSVSIGGTVTLSFSVSGENLSYQWFANGVAISGATSSTLTLTNVQPSQAETYSVTVSNSYGSVTNNIATVSIATARIINLSARASVGTGSNILIAGFVIGGSGNKSVLLRGVGPALGTYGVSNYLTNPVLTLVNPTSGATIASNTGWSSNAAALSNAFTQTGAFAFPANSADSALLATLAAGSYSSEVAGVNGGTGVALAEIYDADTGTPLSRLINISARANVGTGSNVLIAGFVLGGSGTETLLIRGIGPTLASYGVAGTLAAPQLVLSDSTGATIATNIGWSTNPVPGSSTVSATVSQASAAVMSGVGAFALTAGSADSAMLVTVPVGSYSATVSGVGGGTGVGLVEVYEVSHE